VKLNEKHKEFFVLPLQMSARQSIKLIATASCDKNNFANEWKKYSFVLEDIKENFPSFLHSLSPF